MATPKRIWYPGASYHITARGNHKDDVFREEADFIIYLKLVKECLKYYEEYNYELVCYCLMTNHIHLQIKTNEKEVTDLIRRLHSTYTLYFNKKYDCVGHLWQDKYFAKLITNDKQMLEASKYIHLNPVKANIVQRPEEYKWSSYAMYLGAKEEKLICSSRILSYFKEERKRQLYKEYICSPEVQP